MRLATFDGRFVASRVKGTRMPVTELLSISLTVADLVKTAAFYRDGLGLKVGAVRPVDDSASHLLLGLETSASARAVDVTLGHQQIELVAFDPPGQPYPSERASSDQWFQHLALVCGDIALAWKRLQSASPGVITQGVPVLLPPNTGRVTAYKFRDPEGRPLELICFPQGVGDPVWHAPSPPGIRGFDHTAISVLDLERSLAFYTGLLGFHMGGTSLNRGPEQDRLDGLQGCEVDVVGLVPATVATPHLELLHYRAPPGRALPAPLRANDAASARMILKVDALDALVARLEAAGVPFLSPGVLKLNDGTNAAAVRDPDGHMIVLRG